MQVDQSPQSNKWDTSPPPPTTTTTLFGHVLIAEIVLCYARKVSSCISLENSSDTKKPMIPVVYHSSMDTVKAILTCR